MDWGLIILRVVHIGSAMVWFGGAVIGGFFLAPTASALGDAGQPFMDHLMKRRRMAILFPVVAVLTVAAGAALLWRDSDGLQWAWITSPTGFTWTIGGLAATASLVLGFVLVGPSVALQSAVRKELASTGSTDPDAGQRARLERADRLMKLASRVDLPLLLFAGLTMAVGRYL